MLSFSIMSSEIVRCCQLKKLYIFDTKKASTEMSVLLEKCWTSLPFFIFNMRYKKYLKNIQHPGFFHRCQEEKEILLKIMNTEDSIMTFSDPSISFYSSFLFFVKSSQRKPLNIYLHHKNPQQNKPTKPTKPPKLT